MADGWVQVRERVNGSLMTSMRWTVDGVIVPEPEIELVSEQIEMGDGTFATTSRWMAVAPLSPAVTKVLLLEAQEAEPSALA
jgi:hypothetical protein